MFALSSALDRSLRAARQGTKRFPEEDEVHAHDPVTTGLAARGRRAARRRTLAVALTAATIALATTVAACGGDASSSGGDGAAYEGNLTYWYWAESDAPGANKWMASMIRQYEKLHPKVHIKLVLQSTDTLIGAFKTASQTKRGPDIATQWATLPVLTPAWTGASVPISDYASKSEIANWIGTQENMSGGKLWGMPIYLLGVPFVWNKQMFKEAGLNPDQPPATFQDLLTACAKLKAKGFTPIGMGNKDGYTGNWMFALFGKQQLDDIDELKDAMLGKAKFSDPKYSGFYNAIAQLRQRGCFNDDISSLDLNQGWQLFPRKKAAMSWTTDGNALAWAKQVGADNIGVGPTPTLGSGALARSYDTTQSSSAFITSWSKHKKAAATFLQWLHQPPQMKAWYDATGVFPADKRFPESNIKDPIARKLFELDQRASVWPENYLPPQVDQNADLPAGQMITSGSGTPAKAAALWDRVIQQWKTQHPDEFQQYQQWASG
jgi:raffinose/stachyose/melibiose transport system substrate-binding protein